MLELAPRQVRALARAGLVRPARGPRGEYRFSFPDLVVLRTARGLLQAGVAFARVRRALVSLRDRLPAGRPLTSLRVTADRHRVIVRDGDSVWEPESGQVLLDFPVVEVAERVAPLARDHAHQGRSGERALAAEEWFEIGCDLELTAPEEARDAYRRALELDPMHADSHVNLGRLLHEREELAAAERHYRSALAARPGDRTALFNLGVVLEDRTALREAALAYREVLLGDPDHADAHFNLAGVYERLGQRERALRHLKAYRRLIERRGGEPDAG